MWEETLRLELVGAKWIITISLSVNIREYLEQQGTLRRLRRECKDGILFWLKIKKAKYLNLYTSMSMNNRFQSRYAVAQAPAWELGGAGVHGQDNGLGGAGVHGQDNGLRGAGVHGQDKCLRGARNRA